MYHIQNIQIGIKHELYPYCDRVTKAANNLKNATLYRCRQVLTAVDKEESSWTPNEREVMEETRLTAVNHEWQAPGKGTSFLSYVFLDALMKDTKNPDYYSADLPRQSAQHTIKGVVRDMKSFYAAIRSYKKKPEPFTGRPALPRYSRSGGNLFVRMTNQDCVIQEKAEHYFLKLPLTKTRCSIGAPSGKLKQVEIRPTHGIFVLTMIFDDGLDIPVLKESSRIASIDFGVDNFAAITNNIGEPCLLFKGGVIKSINQNYNKRLADIMSRETIGTTKKFVPTPESRALTIRRNNQMDDFMHKFASRLMGWCREHQIDILVLGHNAGWKRESSMGSMGNQNFVQIPFSRAMQILEYLGERNGIRVIRQEESYTSKASFLDRDDIPVYHEGDATHHTFSGKRRPTRHAGMYKKEGFRGLYTSANGIVINADLNGSANIGRKHFPDMYHEIAPDFSRVLVFKHPDQENQSTLRDKQCSVQRPISRSKQHRLNRKHRVA